MVLREHGPLELNGFYLPKRNMNAQVFEDFEALISRFYLPKRNMNTFLHVRLS